jgi:drug/metabolite transporter (DMT)-like permease
MAEPPHKRSILALILFVTLGVVWGMTPTLTKIGVSGGIPPLGYALLQMTGGTVFLFTICLWRGALPPLSRMHLRYYVVAGLVNVALPQAAQVFTLRHVPLTAFSLILTLSPLLTYGIALGVRIERFAVLRFAGLCLGLLGAALILVPQGGLPSPDILPWALLGLVTPSLYAVSNVYISVARPAASDSLALAAAMMLMTVLFMLPAVAATDSFYVPRWPFTAADYAVTAHIVGSGIGALLFFEIMRLTGPVFLSQVAYFMILIGITSGIAIFGEIPSDWMLVAAAAIVLGLGLVTWPMRRPGRVISDSPG